MTLCRPKIVFLVTEDWYFCSHRLDLGRAARDAGYEVVVAARMGAAAERLQREGFKLAPLPLRRLGVNPLRELRLLTAIAGCYLRERPDIVHHVGLKPILYGSFCAAVAGVPAVVNAVAGLGQAAMGGWFGAGVLRAYKWALRNSTVIVQNDADRKALEEADALPVGRWRLIPGSGVDTVKFKPAPEPEGTPTVVLPARMIWAKGVGEFVKAAQLLHRRGVAVRMVLVGEPDKGNVASVSEKQLAVWAESGIIEWWGRRDDMATILAGAHIICLPSYYGEGVPKCLLEAAASARPAVTTDSPGCRDIVRDKENGLLVPVRNASALADAIAELASDAELRRRMGLNGRVLVERKFSSAIVNAEFLKLYSGLLQLNGGLSP